MSEWAVILEPVTGDAFRRGLRIMLSNGTDEHEVSRVAFARQDSRNPKETFDQVLNIELDKAYEAAEVLNEVLADFERLRLEEQEAARERIKAILGPPSRSQKMA